MLDKTRLSSSIGYSQQISSVTILYVLFRNRVFPLIITHLGIARTRDYVF